MKKPSHARLLLPAALTMAALVCGAIPLQRAFDDERMETLASLKRERRTVEALASKLLAESLAHRLAEVAETFPALAEGPLLADEGVYWRDPKGRVLLPRPKRDVVA